MAESLSFVWAFGKRNRAMGFSLKDLRALTGLKSAAWMADLVTLHSCLGRQPGDWWKPHEMAASCGNRSTHLTS